jgi:hypothetical protein
MFSFSAIHLKYHKPPNISPELIFVCKMGGGGLICQQHLNMVGLYMVGIIFGGGPPEAYIQWFTVFIYIFQWFTVLHTNSPD